MIGQAFKKFWKDFETKSKLKLCPILYEWFEQKIKKWSELPDKPSREGVSRGDTFPMPRMKVLLMLSQVVHPKLKLKNYAETWDLSYGTVRNWNADPDFIEKRRQLKVEFAGVYTGRVRELILSDDRALSDADRSKMRNCTNEVVHYQDAELLSLLNSALEALDVPTDYLHRQMIFAFLYSFTILDSRKDVASQIVRRLLFEEHLEFGFKLTAEIFDMLISEIKKGNTDTALRLAEALKEKVMEDSMPVLMKVAMDLYDTKRKIK